MIDERAAIELLHRAGQAIPVTTAPTAVIRERGRRHGVMVRTLQVTVAVAAVALIAAVPALSGAVGDRDTPPVAQRRIPTPPADAAPGDVVRAYINALGAHDIDTAKSLTTSEHAARVERAEDSWYRNVVSIREIRIDTPVPEDGDRPHAAAFAEVVFVPVRFVLELRHEGSMQDGETVWGYRLGRQSAATRWVIFDEGPI